MTASLDVGTSVLFVLLAAAILYAVRDIKRRPLRACGVIALSVILAVIQGLSLTSSQGNTFVLAGFAVLVVVLVWLVVAQARDRK